MPPFCDVTYALGVSGAPHETKATNKKAAQYFIQSPNFN
jgi:hypothetical protein